jgi:hypothetical protein
MSIYSCPRRKMGNAGYKRSGHYFMIPCALLDLMRQVSLDDYGNLREQTAVSTRQSS